MNFCKCILPYFCLCSVAQSCLTLWIVALQAPLSMGFSRQEYWSRLPFPLWGILLTPGLNSCLLHCRQILYHLNNQGSPQNKCIYNQFVLPEACMSWERSVRETQRCWKPRASRAWVPTSSLSSMDRRAKDALCGFHCLLPAWEKKLRAPMWPRKKQTAHPQTARWILGLRVWGWRTKGTWAQRERGEAWWKGVHCDSLHVLCGSLLSIQVYFSEHPVCN